MAVLPPLPGPVDPTPCPSSDGWPVAASQVRTLLQSLELRGAECTLLTLTMPPGLSLQVALPAAEELMADPVKYGETFQLVAIRNGEIVYEACGEGRDPESTSVSWCVV